MCAKCLNEMGLFILQVFLEFSRSSEVAEHQINPPVMGESPSVELEEPGLDIEKL